MGKRKSQIELAIEKAQAEINVLETVISRLREAQKAQPKRKLKAVSDSSREAAKVG